MSRPFEPTARERQLLARLRTPRSVQRYLRQLAYNHEPGGATLRSFRSTVRAGRAHCLEAALVGAAALERRGYPPLLLDLESQDYLDHVLFVFRENGRWGSVGRSRDPGLHGRRPVFASLVALVRSYVLPFIDKTGRIIGWGLYDLRDLSPRVDWRGSARNVWAVERALIDNRHHALRTSNREYTLWHRRYLDFAAAQPGDKPVYYPDRQTWW